MWVILASITWNYFFGYAIQAVPENFRKKTLLAGVCGNLGLLCYFKYGGFIIQNVTALTAWHIEWKEIIIPLAISFFTFQQIAYLVDVYREKRYERNILRYSVFVAFFPQLIAGPIVQHKELIPQLQEELTISEHRDRFVRGIALFIIGLFKKVVLADNVGTISNYTFGEVHAGMTLAAGEAWLGVLAYTAQIYLDFSAYSDMAIGVGMMFGIRLPDNFNFPYHSLNIIDFWRRWHMTLSKFLRDYLYIPLGGNRCKDSRQKFNLMLTMLLGGLWHGAGWNFIVWGGLHGIYLIINHQFQKRSKFEIPRPIAWMMTFLAVVIAWVFFRSKGLPDAFAYFSQMTSFELQPFFVLKCSIFWICVIWIATEKHLTKFQDTWPYACFVGFLGCASLLFLGEEQEFIYFNF